MVKDRQIRRITGVKELAKEAKCSRTMIYNVARGRSTSARIAAILQKHGIAVECRTSTKEATR